MAKKSYFEKLKDPRWQKKRLEMLEAAEWRCEICYNDELSLHVHHKAYLKGREPWEYERDQLAVLCESCHEATHESDLLMEAASWLALDGPKSREQFAYFIAGSLGMDVQFPNKAVAASYLLGVKFEREYFQFLDGLKDPESRFSKGVEMLMREQK